MVLWGITFLLAYLGPGQYLNELAEDIDRSLIPTGLTLFCLASLLVSVVTTWIWAFRRKGTGEGTVSASGMGRRRFLVGSVSTLGGLIGAAVATIARPLGWMTTTLPAIARTEAPTSDPNPRDSWQGSRIEAYRRLGRTEAQVSDIALGSGRIKGEKGETIAREAIARGINYFDTSPDYSAEGSELALGRAMKGQRDKMFLATKFCTPQGHLRQGVSSVQDYMDAVEGSLRRLQTDRVDLVHIHSCNSVARLLDPNAHEAFDRLKEQGKVRLCLPTTTGPGRSWGRSSSGRPPKTWESWQ
jgi:hypothetical protein